MAGLLIAAFLQGCIHEYPHYVPGKGPDKGEDPTSVDAEVNIIFDLSWEKMLHRVSFGSRARDDSYHRFTIELFNEDELISRDVVYLSDNEFSRGSFRHRLSEPLKKKSYNLAVWYDMQDADGNYIFDSNSLSNVELVNFSTTQGDYLHCAHAGEQIDLTSFDTEKENTITKEIELRYPGARFEIVATDVQQFITEQKEALNQGDTFKVNLSVAGGGYSNLNILNGYISTQHPSMEYSGRMRLPFADYDELKIAEGFFFCYPEDDVTMQLSVINSASSTVSRTEYFSFPVKRGYITTISGDFLTHPMDGIFSINNIWEGEIVIEI